MKLTEAYDMQRQSLPQKHDHGLRVPEVVDVRDEVTHALHREPVKDGGDPNVRVTTPKTEGWNGKVLFRFEICFCFYLMIIIMIQTRDISRPAGCAP